MKLLDVNPPIDDGNGVAPLASPRLLHSFGLFYDAHFHDVLAYFYRRTSDPQVSADLTAETFAEALRCVRKYNDKRGSEREWLFGIARHELSHYLRAQQVHNRAMKKMGITSLTVDDALIDFVESQLHTTEMLPALRASLDDLSAPLRDAVVLRILHGLSFDEVAARLGCTVPTARVRVSRGLTRLHDLLSGAYA